MSNLSKPNVKYAGLKCRIYPKDVGFYVYKKRFRKGYQARNALFSNYSHTWPRQSGKTTLAKAVFDKHAYVSLEKLSTRDFAIKKPEDFLEEHSNKRGLF